MNKEQILNILNTHYDELKKFGVKSLALFGSVARGEENTNSDTDVLVEFDPNYDKIGLIAFMRLRYHLEELLGTRVDLVTPNALKRQLKTRILKEAIYANQRLEAAD
jgi:predicted nucleotidyltransferase